MKISKFFLRGFSRPSDALVSSLGKLERATLEEVWRQKEVNVRQVSTAFEDRIAYTTVMTTLDRLFKKGLLDRRKSGKAFFYTARYTPDELENGIREDVIGCLLNERIEKIEPVLACIVDAVSERDLELLDDLERLVQEKRIELQGKKSA